ncbi:MAG: D-ribose pyranase, partial [Thermoanaerobacteraceae bacterium]|nr:D-ribose pyranase [Thermoanaerobacteraceae bacterium]
FLDVLDAVLTEMSVEKVTIASEMKQQNANLYKIINERFKDVEIEEITHNDFKNQTAKAQAVIRTGEFKPFANIILQSGVVF